MLDKIMGLDPQVVQGWIAVVALLIGLVQAWRQSKETSRWAKIRALVPDAHRLAQRAASLTKTAKDDEFIRQLGRLLKAWGVELHPDELDAVRAMGSAEHQSFKLLRAAAEGVPGQEILEVAQQLDPPVQGSQALEREP